MLRHRNHSPGIRLVEKGEMSPHFVLIHHVFLERVDEILSILQLADLVLYNRALCFANHITILQVVVHQ